MCSFMDLKMSKKWKVFLTLIYIHKDSLHCVFFYYHEQYSGFQRLNHTDYIHRGSLSYVIFCIFEDDCVLQRLYQNDYNHSVSLYNVFFMQLKTTATCNGLITLITLTVFLSSMCSSKQLKITVWCKSLTTLITFIVFPSLQYVFFYATEEYFDR